MLWLYYFMHYLEIIKKIRQNNDSVILFHSATGKDSIMLCDLLSKFFNSILCVFMYLVKGLEYERKYINWTNSRYKNITWLEIPHYCTSSFIRSGYLGINKDTTYPKIYLHKLDKLVREKTNIDFSIYGFKKNDGLTRRLMLNRLNDGISYTTNKAYPLMDYKNSEVLKYIKDNNLINPFNYNTKKPSSGCDISQPLFLKYIKERYPKDLEKIINQYPLTEAILFNYENNS